MGIGKDTDALEPIRQNANRGRSHFWDFKATEASFRVWERGKNRFWPTNCRKCFWEIQKIQCSVAAPGILK